MARTEHGVPLAPLTTMRVGGPAATLVTARTEEEIVAAVRAADEGGGPLLLLSGGSNLVIADDGFPGTVVRIAAEGIEVLAQDERSEERRVGKARRGGWA